jgi:hypothetical protein
MIIKVGHRCKRSTTIGSLALAKRAKMAREMADPVAKCAMIEIAVNYEVIATRTEG